MAAYHIDCWNRLKGMGKLGFAASFPSRCAAGTECNKGGQIATGDRIWGVKEDGSDWDKRRQSPRPPVTLPNRPTTTAGALALLRAQQRLAEEDRLKAQRDTQLPSETNETDDDEPNSSRDEDIHFPEERTHVTANGSGFSPPIADPTAALDKAVTQLLPVIQSMVNDKVGGMVDVDGLTDKVTANVLAGLKSIVSTTVEVKNVETGEVKNIGVQHKQFKLLLQCVQARVNVWMAGPSGSGKTTAAMNVALALALKFYYTGAVSDPFSLLGYKNALGEYVRTAFREAWEHGGVFLWDEVDASDPNALLAFNACLANGSAPFPDGVIAKHPDCVLVAAANTWGHGATHDYVGRMKMDAAFLKRFAFLSWEYDEQMEWNTAPNRMWTKRVQEVRRRVVERGLRVLVTPRESYIGAALLAQGIEQPIVEAMTIKSGMTDEQWRLVS